MSGHSLLAMFLFNHGITQVAAGAALGVSHASVSFWCNERAVPDHLHALAIERWTNGAVPAVSWLSDDQRAALEAVRPVDLDRAA